MDELEISGKRYISTRRAAKEYKYHADYIGQLIRGKKLVGRKVGRSWYVELTSLTEYFGKEAQLAEPSTLVAKEVKEEIGPVEEVVEEAIEEAAPLVVEVMPEVPQVKEETKIVIQEVEEPTHVEIEANRDSIHIPIRRPSFEAPSSNKIPSLTYIDDSEPILPRGRRSLLEEATTSVMPQSEEEAEIIEDEMDLGEPIQKKSFSILPYFSIAALGGIVLVIVMFGSIIVKSHMIIEAGKAASVQYSLQ